MGCRSLRGKGLLEAFKRKNFCPSVVFTCCVTSWHLVYIMQNCIYIYIYIYINTYIYIYIYIHLTEYIYIYTYVKMHIVWVCLHALTTLSHSIFIEFQWNLKGSFINCSPRFCRPWDLRLRRRAQWFFHVPTLTHPTSHIDCRHLPVPPVRLMIDDGSP